MAKAADILTRVKNYIAANALLSDRGRCIVALSGGADSVALLLMLRRLGYHVEAAHCNFHLRGDESDRDEEFVRNLCQERKVSLHIVHFATRDYASLHKVSIEMAARELRYKYFDQLRRDIGAEAVGVAHHREDSVETLLINLLRGTGLHGLTGISPRNGHIVRPLLCVSREEIEEYLKESEQTFVTDSTNLIDDVVRNKIRLDIMPLLRSITPAADANIFNTSQRLAEAAKVYDKAIGEQRTAVFRDNAIDIAALKQLPSPESTLYDILKDYGFTPATIVQIASNINAPTGRVFSSETHDLATDRGRLLIAKRHEPPHTMTLPEEGRYALSDGSVVTLTIEASSNISREKNTATLDADRVVLPLRIRVAKRGDRFVPFGMSGMKLVSDYLTDLKISVIDKRRQLVAEDATGKIVWLVGQRTSQTVAITAESQRTLRLTLECAKR